MAAGRLGGSSPRYGTPTSGRLGSNNLPAQDTYATDVTRNAPDLRPTGAVAGPEGTQVTYGPKRDEELRNQILAMLKGSNNGITAPTISRMDGDIAAKEQASRDAAFNRYKDRAGENARAALNSLRESLSSSGRAGGQFSDEQTAGLISEVGGGLDSFLRDQAINEATRAQQVGDLEYQGGIQQRGQTLGAEQQSRNALLSLLSSGLPIY